MINTRMGAAILALCSLIAAGAEAQTCKPLTEVASLDADIDGSGNIYLPVTIEGHNARVLLDTAGIYNFITTKTVDEMHLTRVPMNPDLDIRIVATNERARNTVAVHSMQLGNLVAGRIPFLEMKSGTLPSDVAGTLAPAVLIKYDVEIDPMGKKVNLFLPEHCPGVIYWTRSAAAAVPMRIDQSGLHVIVPVKLDDQSIYATIDTGSTRSWIVYNWASRALPADDLKDPAQGGAYDFPFKTLSFNGIAVTNPKIIVMQQATAQIDESTLIVGMDILSHLHTYISYRDHMLYVTAADAR